MVSLNFATSKKRNKAAKKFNSYGLRDLSVRLKILLSTVIAIILLLGVGVTGLINSNKLKHLSNSMYTENLTPIITVDQIRVGNRIILAYLLETIITDDPAVKTEHNDTIKKILNDIDGYIEKLSALPNLSEEQKASFASFVNSLPELKESIQKMMDTIEAGKKSEAYGFYNQVLLDKIGNTNKGLGEFNTSLQQNAETNFEESSKSADNIRLTDIIITVLGVILLTIAGQIITRSIVYPLGQIRSLMAKAEEGDLKVAGDYVSKDEIGMLTSSFNAMMVGIREIVFKVNESALTLSASSEELTANSEQTTRAAEQIAVSTNQMADGFDSQVQSVMQATGAASEVAAGVTGIKEKSSEVIHLSVAASAKTEEGVIATHGVVNGMNEINQNVQETQVIIRNLSNRSDEIGAIITSINEIAAQTNLLSLNASIEAARAGEAGRGFAVVAGEIRKLADAAAQSSNQIAAIITTIQQETELAVKSMNRGAERVKYGVVQSEQASGAFASIQQAITTVLQKVEEVGVAVENVSEQSQHMATAMQSVSSISQEGAAAVQQTSAASQEQLSTMQEVASSAKSLAVLAEDLQTTLSRFTV